MSLLTNNWSTDVLRRSFKLLVGFLGDCSGKIKSCELMMKRRTHARVLGSKGSSAMAKLGGGSQGSSATVNLGGGMVNSGGGCSELIAEGDRG